MKRLQPVSYTHLNITLPDDGEYQIGKYGRMRRSYLKEYRKILYNNYVLEGTLSKHLAEIDQACNERMKNVVSAMAKQEDVTEALKAADQMEWVRRINSIHNRAEEIILTELVYACLLYTSKRCIMICRTAMTTVLKIPTTNIPEPIASPMPAVAQIPAAVVSPLMVFPFLKMTPAPRKLIPLTTWAATVSYTHLDVYKRQL